MRPPSPGRRRVSRGRYAGHRRLAGIERSQGISVRACYGAFRRASYRAQANMSMPAQESKAPTQPVDVQP